MKLKHPQQSTVKNTKEYKSIRLDPSLRDELITEQGALDAEEAGRNIDWQDVGLILVSPMRRCLETCRKMIAQSNRKIDVFVEPLLKGRLSSVWGYGHSVEHLKCCYP